MKRVGKIFEFLISYECTRRHMGVCRGSASIFGSRYVGRATWLPKNSDEGHQRTGVRVICSSRGMKT